MDLVVEGRLWLDGAPVQGCVGIKGGRIAAVKKLLPGRPRIRFDKGVVLPGVIDCHVHMRDPGHPDKEDFATGTAAAACGGVTCVLDMPNTSPPTVDGESLGAKLAAARARSAVDFGLFLGLRDGREAPPITEGAVGYKAYLGATTGSLLVRRPQTVQDALRGCRTYGAPVAFHGEDQGVLDRMKARCPSPMDLAGHREARPPSAEAESIRTLKSMDTSMMHFCHLSTAEGLSELAGWKGTVEVSPHHLLLDSNCGLGATGKVNPPLRGKSDRAALWEAVRDGRIHIIASDHAPHTQDDKEKPFNEAPSGMPGVETMAPLIMMEVVRGSLELGRAVDMLCRAPAERFRLNKGVIEAGRDADLVVFDLKKSAPIRGERLHSKCGWTPYERRDAVFPVWAACRGVEVSSEGDFTGEPGRGRPVVRL